MLGGVSPSDGVADVAATVSVIACADGVDKHFDGPGAVTRTDTGTDGMVTGPTVAESEVSARAVPVNAVQQLNVATASVIIRALGMLTALLLRGSRPARTILTISVGGENGSHSKVFPGDQKASNFADDFALVIDALRQASILGECRSR